MILVYPNKFLSTPTKRVNFAIDKNLKELSREMFSQMYNGGGVGLAANQIGVGLSIIVINPTGDALKDDHELIMINPIVFVDQFAQMIEREEGCLSLPNYTRKISRPRFISTIYHKLDGTLTAAVFEGFLSRIIQHEVNHLHGITLRDLDSYEGYKMKGFRLS